MSAAVQPPMSTYGLASQLRTPPSPERASSPDNRPVSPTLQISSNASKKKVTPAMREEQKSGSKFIGAPAWISRNDSASSIKNKLTGRRSSLAQSTRSDNDGEVVFGSNRESQDVKSITSAKVAGEKAAPMVIESIPAPPPSPPLLHITSRPKAAQEPQQSSTTSAPKRPNRPTSPPFEVSSLGNNLASVASSTLQEAPRGSAPPVDFAFAPLPQGRLDLGVQFDRTTGTIYSSTYSPNANQGPLEKASPLITSSPATASQQDVFALAPPRPVSPQPSSEPIGLGLRKQSITAAMANGEAIQMAMPFPAATVSPAEVSKTVVPAGFVAPNNSGRLPGNLLPLARRTAHVSETPGYGWRLNLLEKLESIMGSFLTIQDAEAILSIGANPKKQSNRTNERKSLIGMPPALTPKVHRKLSKNSDLGAKNTFFLKMKRALGNPSGDHDKSGSLRAQASKGIFGVSLATAAEYGFVTSMIAGQRHDLPGVCFSSVEEIYRRGQGMNVPGLLISPGEASRIAKLVAIYDSPPDYGEHHDLSIESIHNVTSLLKKYLADLPEPILDRRLWKLFLSACVYSSNPIKIRVASAQAILRLLPTPNFSLLVYLVAFLSQIPLFPENRITLESVSNIFGASIMSPRHMASPSLVSKSSKMIAHITGPTDMVESAGENAKKAKESLLWLLKHWSLVADGLLEPDFDIDIDSLIDRDSADPESASPIMRQSEYVGELDGSADPLRFLPAPKEKEIIQEEDEEIQPATNNPRQTLVIDGNAAKELSAVTEEASVPTTPTTLDIQSRSVASSVNARSPVVEAPLSPVAAESVYSTTDSPALTPAPAHETASYVEEHHEQKNRREAPAIKLENEPLPESPELQDEDDDVPPPTPSKDTVFPIHRSTEAPSLPTSLPTTPIDESEPATTHNIHQVTSRELEEDFVVPDHMHSATEEEAAVPALEEHLGNKTSSRASSDSSGQSDVVTPATTERNDSVLAAYVGDGSQRSSKISQASRRSIGSATGFPRAQPEDAYGPVAPMVGQGSVLDDLMDFDEDPALYKFPTPPGSAKAGFSDISPTVLASIAKMQATRRASKASVSSETSNKSGPRGFPPLVEAARLEDARITIDSQRVEITDLWKQLTDLEGQREGDRKQLSQLQAQIVELRTAADSKPQVDEASIRAEYDAKLSESQKEISAAQEQVQKARSELDEVKKELEIKDADSKKQIASLSSQLDAIRSLLMAGMSADTA